MFGFRSLTPYNSGDKREDLLDNFFNEPFFPLFMGGNELKTDIKEDDQKYDVKVEIPGVEKKDIGINYDGNDVLSVSVSRKEEKEDKQNGYIRKERSEGSSRREFYLPGVSVSGIKAKYENGILEIELPKKESGTGKHPIEIE